MASDLGSKGAKCYSYFEDFQAFSEFIQRVPLADRNFYQILSISKKNEYVYEFYDIDLDVDEDSDV